MIIKIYLTNMEEQTKSISFNEVQNMALEDYPVKFITIDEDGDPIDINENLRLAWMKGFIRAKRLYRNSDK